MTAVKTPPTTYERVLKKLGKRPQTAKQLALKLGFTSGQALSKTLSYLVRDGHAIIVVKDGVKGYAKIA